jgi:hypothetical protein
MKITSIIRASQKTKVLYKQIFGIAVYLLEN